MHIFVVLFGGGTGSSGPLEPSSVGFIIPHTTHGVKRCPVAHRQPKQGVKFDEFQGTQD